MVVMILGWNKPGIAACAIPLVVDCVVSEPWGLVESRISRLDVVAATGRVFSSLCHNPSGLSPVASLTG